MPSFNKVVLIGRLVRDPERSATQNGTARTRFQIAVDRPYKDPETGQRKTDFFRCTAWRQKADFVAEYVGKGRLVSVSGRIEINESTDRDGVKKTYTDIQVEDVQTLEPLPRDPNAAPASLSPSKAPSPGYPEDDFDDSDPFADQ